MGRHKIKSAKQALGKLVNKGEYGGHEIYTGSYSTASGHRMWTQVDDEENHGQPAVDIEVVWDDDRIYLYTEEDNKPSKTWELPEYVYELDKIAKEIDKELEKYYSQFEEQPRFVRKGS